MCVRVCLQRDGGVFNIKRRLYRHLLASVPAGLIENAAAARRCIKRDRRGRAQKRFTSTEA